MRYALRTLLSASALVTAAASTRAVAQQPLMPALNVADVDTTCKPCEDFYKFATGGLAKRTPIPPAFSNWSGFAELTDRNSNVVRGILEGAAADANTTKDASRRKLGQFYATCMDTAAIERRGYDPICADLARIDQISNRKELLDAILRMHANGIGGIFGFGAGPDANDSRRVIFQVSQGGLGMPDRDYYSKTDSATLAIFLGWAQARRTIWRDQSLRLAVQTDVHSPGEFRVNGPLSNLAEFAAAFGCKKGDKMVRDTPVRIF